MRRLRTTALAGLCLLFASSLARGQDEVYGADKGEWVFSLSGAWSYVDTDVSKTEEFTFFSSAGYFFSRHHEVGFLLAPTFSSGELKSDGTGINTTVVDFAPYYHYNFYIGSKANVYVGGSLGLLLIDSSVTSSETNYGWGLTAGLRYWLSQTIAINIQPRFTHTSGDSLGGSQDSFQVLFGVAARL